MLFPYYCLAMIIIVVSQSPYYFRSIGILARVSIADVLPSVGFGNMPCKYVRISGPRFGIVESLYMNLGGYREGSE
jgi:hypothetical protein